MGTDDGDDDCGNDGDDALPMTMIENLEKCVSTWPL
eukprot:CAMPEP_0168193868 /NCGR_PEP_ID=MMETSP0139_2-20121125/18849_1 /TAXON_ID=44445 /ORGANISM="Pseudo-nitzschia australis, Strain 10249 10 AB" /LENGTH=35 /DNA_ID= /DNA_START= /DNA_END= /DNA_ORIENTATION=